MTKPMLKYLSIILAIYLVSLLIPTVYIQSVFAILLMGLVLLLVNLVIKPILLILALPFNILTFGLFSFVVNALTIMIADGFVSGVNMGGFLNSLLTALIIVVLHQLLPDRKKPSYQNK
ncbi:MAG: putative rane protein, partial [Sporolactobacillus laevolacticus]|nr:putative rane protein [Sporolactobacillus laevolacticus]